VIVPEAKAINQRTHETLKMRRDDLLKIMETYRRHNIEIEAERIVGSIAKASQCVAEVPEALMGYPLLRHRDFLASERIGLMRSRMVKEQSKDEINMRRMKEWGSVVKNVKRVHAAMVSYGNVRVAQNKKISAICARELRRALSRTSKINPVLKSKRIHKELTGQIKRTERTARERSKKAEKAEAERIRKEMEDKEEERQKKKVEFLLGQSELFTYFVRNKSAGAENAEEAVGIQAAIKQVEGLREFETERMASPAEGEEAVKRVKTEEKAAGQYVAQPRMLKCRLKEYQIKGLSWLVNLYDMGINGILADDMGLGKTVQSISLLAYLYETERIPGPFLVVTPASTLHNWSQEFSKFLPTFRVCHFWGSTAERREQKKGLRSANVVVTSYQTAVADEKVLRKIKWQYMILDEAQAIKSSASQRWRILLSFKARNRLLLTGTPIQNSMQELWALLHFIMPTLFDSLVEFSDWFSKDIESSATLKKAVDEESLQRLHTILKPFMLRRHKSDVIHELGQKTHIDLHCDLSYRQRMLYEEIRKSCSSMEMENLVMQLKKVCNHPDLFEKLEPTCGLSFELSDGIGDVVGFGRSKLNVRVPTIVAEDAVERLMQNEAELRKRIRALEEAALGGEWYLRNSMDFRNGSRVLRSLREVRECSAEPEKSELCRAVGACVREEAYGCEQLVLHTGCVISSAPKLVSHARYPECHIEGLYAPLNRIIHVPPLDTFISDSGKLAMLDMLLPGLKAQGHRLLIYFQMTRMIDLMEDYLVKKGYSYLRLDGSSRIANRRDMVKEWQTKDKFIFLLSTRAGGLGINLTAADTVIFYDSDWNPTVDQQAMDRAHRLGQTRNVTVYRLITRGTIEEKVIERASQKDEIQKMVIHGNIFEGKHF
jgi:chromatin-remodeling ATPase INO80